MSQALAHTDFELLQGQMDTVYQVRDMYDTGTEHWNALEGILNLCSDLLSEHEHQMNWSECPECQAQRVVTLSEVKTYPKEATSPSKIEVTMGCVDCQFTWKMTFRPSEDEYVKFKENEE